jgi:hypothetical protein
MLTGFILPWTSESLDSIAFWHLEITSIVGHEFQWNWISHLLLAMNFSGTDGLFN